MAANLIELIRQQKETIRQLQAQLSTITEQEVKLKKKPVRTEYESEKRLQKEKQLKKSRSDLRTKIRHAESELLSLEKQRQLSLF